MKNIIKARVVIEMLGAPKEHIQGTLQLYIEKLKKEEKKMGSIVCKRCQRKLITHTF